MDDALLVRRVQRVGDLSADRNGLLDRQRWCRGAGLARESIGERIAIDQFEHEGAHWCRFFEAVDRRDVRMIERGEQLGLAFESDQAVGIGGERRR